MTHSHSYQDSEASKSDKSLAKFQQNHPNAKKLLSEYGQGIRSKTFTSSDNVTSDTPCFNGPKTLIKLSSIISIEKLTEGVTVKLRYELFTMDDGEEPKSLGVWVSEKANIDIGEVEFRSHEGPFSSISYEYIFCPQCCNYLISITPVKIEENIK